MVRLEGRVSPLTLPPPRSQQVVLQQLSGCPQEQLVVHLRQLRSFRWERCTAVCWHPVLNRFDSILEAYATAQKSTQVGVSPATGATGATAPAAGGGAASERQAAAAGADAGAAAAEVPAAEPDEALVLEVLRVICEVLFRYPELSEAFSSEDRLRALLACSGNPPVMLGALRCLASCPAKRMLQGPPIDPETERRLEALAGGLGWLGMSPRAACAPENSVGDFVYELPRNVCGGGGAACSPPLVVPVAGAAEQTSQELVSDLLARSEVPEAYCPALQLHLGLWRHSLTTAGRREVIAISLYALCAAIKYAGPALLQQHLQARPGLFAELCELLQALDSVGHEAGCAALRLAGAILDSRYSRNRVETTQLAQILGLSVPHGVVTCALRGLLSEQPADPEQLEGQRKLLTAALEFFQITTAANHRTAVQVGHAGMVLAMLEFMQKVEVEALHVVTSMLRCLELAAAVSGATALVLFREFSGLQAFSTRLQQEVDLLTALDFTGDVDDLEPPGPEDPEASARFWALLDEVAARRRLCRQLLRNIQVALQQPEVAQQAGLTNVFQGPLLEVLGKALQEPEKVGLCLFGAAVDIVSNLIQDDPSRVPQMIESGVLPGIVGALRRSTMRSVECLSAVPALLGSVSLHADGEEFILKAPTRPVKLIMDTLVEPCFAQLLNSRADLAQTMSTHFEKLLQNRPAGSTRLTDHVVECIVGAMTCFLEQGRTYPPFDPHDMTDRTELLADRIAAISRFCWSVLGTSERTLETFLNTKGLKLLRELHELPCLPYNLCSLEGQVFPLTTLFNLQATGTRGSCAVVEALREWLNEGLCDHVLCFMQQYGLTGPGDPFDALKTVPDAEVDAFLRSVSCVATAIEGLLTVLRESAAPPQALETLRGPMARVQELAPAIFALAAWRPLSPGSKMTFYYGRNGFNTYEELAQTVFSSAQDPPSTPAPEAAEEGVPPPAEAPNLPPRLLAAAHCFRLTARTMRQFLVAASKQLHGRTRSRELTRPVTSLARDLAAALRAVAAWSPPSDVDASLRWANDVFELLLRVHEEQSRVAIRPLALCAFYQARGFDPLGPMLMSVADNIGRAAAPGALRSGLGFLERMTSYKRLLNAPQSASLKAEAGLITPGLLCRSVQSEALKCVLPIWRRGDFSKLPAVGAQSLLKIWTHALQQDPAPPVAAAAAAAGRAGPAARGAAQVPGDASPEEVAAVLGGDPAATEAIFGVLAPMGFERSQVMRALVATRTDDIGQLIMWMVSNPADAAAGPAGGAAPAAAPGGPAAGGPPPGAEPAADAAAAAAAGGAEAELQHLGAVDLEKFQAQTTDLLRDFIPQSLLLGRQVPKAAPSVADALAFLVALTAPLPLWVNENEAPVPPGDPNYNAHAVVRACLEDVGFHSIYGHTDTDPEPEKLACLMQVMAILLHRRQQVGAVFTLKPSTQQAAEEAGAPPSLTSATGFLQRLRDRARSSIDPTVDSFSRGYRSICLGISAPAPPGVGAALLSPPTWVTPLLVCAGQMLGLVDLVKLSETRNVLDDELQQDWVTVTLNLMYAFPGADSGFALACLKILTRLCSTPIGSQAFFAFRTPLCSCYTSDTMVTALEGSGALMLVLRFARQQFFPGMLQMVADLALLLLEEGPALLQRMESEILALFTAQNPSLPARSISRQLFHLLNRDPGLFEEALKNVTQQPQGQPADQPLLLEAVPEGERPQRHKQRAGRGGEGAPQLALPPALVESSALVLQTLVMEVCISLEFQHLTAIPRIHETAVTNGAAADKLPPQFPLALGPDSLLYVLHHLLAHLPGLGVLLVRPPITPLEQPPAADLLANVDRSSGSFFIVDCNSFVPQGSMLLVITRHLFQRFAGLAELWPAQLAAAKAALTDPAPLNPLMKASNADGTLRCLTHLAICLCAALRKGMGGAGGGAIPDARRCLASEVVSAVRMLAEGPPEKARPAASAHLLAGICSLVARILGSSPGFFSAPGEIQALREHLADIFARIDLYSADVSAVPATMVRCLECVSRRESKKDGTHAGMSEAPQALGVGDAPVEADEDEAFGDGVVGEELDEEEEEEEDEEGDPEGDALGEEDAEAEEGFDDAMVAGEEGDEHDGEEEEDDDLGDEDDEDEYDDHPEDEEAGPGDLNTEDAFASFLNSAIQVFDQEGAFTAIAPGNMTFHVDISLGESGIIHGVSRGGQLQHMRPDAMRGGWSEPGDLDVPVDHPLLRREDAPARREQNPLHVQAQQLQPPLHHHHHPEHAGRERRLMQWVSGQQAADLSRNLFGGPDAARRRTSAQGAAAAESFDAAFDDFSNRLRDRVRVAAAAGPAAGAAEQAGPAAPLPVPTLPALPAGMPPAETAGSSGSADAPVPAAAPDAAVSAATAAVAPGTPAEATESAPESSASAPAAEHYPAAPHDPGSGAPGDVALDGGAEAAAPSAIESAEAAGAAEGVEEAAAAAPAEEEAVGEAAAAAPAVQEDAAAEPAPAVDDPAAALNIPELARLAAQLGCTQAAILEAAQIDLKVVEELPEDLRTDVVMAEVSQVRLEHLRRGNPPGAAAAAGAGDIDPAVFEALPPEIQRQIEEEERAQQATIDAAQQPNAADMDNAAFIASLDPVLREEVLMTASEELLQTLPPELAAEAQLLRERALNRIALRREQPMQQRHPQRATIAVGPVGGGRAGAHPGAHPGGAGHRVLPQLQAMEQQLLMRMHGGDRRGRFTRRLGPPLRGWQRSRGVALAEDMFAQLGIRFNPEQFAGAASQGVPSTAAADRQLLEHLADFDEGTRAEVPLPVTVVPSVCRLLYLRKEVATLPLARLFLNLSLHPQTRSRVLGHFLLLLCCRARTGAATDALPPPNLYECQGRMPQVNSAEVQAIGSQRVLSFLAYLFRRVPQCGDFFSRQLANEPWMEAMLMDAPLVADATPHELAGQHFINWLPQLLTTHLFLDSPSHATWLLSILHALLTQMTPPEKAAGHAAAAGSTAAASSGASGAPAADAAAPAPAPAAPQVAAAAPAGEAAEKPSVEKQCAERWSKISKDLHAVISQKSILAFCHFLCQAGSGHGASTPSGEVDSFKMVADVLVALARSEAHLEMVRAELMRVLGPLVMDIEAQLARSEAMTAEPSTLEARFLRVVRTLVQVFEEAAKCKPDQDFEIEGFLEVAKVENLWTALDKTLVRLGDTEVIATPAQRLLAMDVAPSAVRIEGSSGLSAATSATLSSNVHAAPPKPLLNRLLPLMEAFFLLHDGSREAAQDEREKEERRLAQEQDDVAGTLPDGVFSESAESSHVDRSRLGVFCKKHRRPLNALAKQTPALLSSSFAPLLKRMPGCLDFDNKRAYFRAQLRSRRLESHGETIRLRVRRHEIFMDSYTQLRMRSEEEMRAKIQVQFEGEEAIDAGGVGKEWYSALAKEIFNPNYALFIQAGGKACTYHPNHLSYVNRDHLQFFQFIGRIIGKAIHDGQNLEAWFTRGFYKHMLGRKVIPADLEAFDPEYFSNLKWMLDHDITDIVELNFTAESDNWGRQKVVELKPRGRELKVTNDNKHEYIQLMSEHKMTNSVRQQIDAFLKGLHDIVPAELLSIFDHNELELLISGLPDIDIEDLKANTEYHNYTPQSEQVQWFWRVLSEFSQEQRAWFLQFATGTSRVPVEGFKGLIGMRGPQKFSIHRAYGADRLPSAHTCFNQLDLPEYPSEETLKEKLMQAVKEGHEGFGFA